MSCNLQKVVLLYMFNLATLSEGTLFPQSTQEVTTKTEVSVSGRQSVKVTSRVGGSHSGSILCTTKCFLLLLLMTRKRAFDEAWRETKRWSLLNLTTKYKWGKNVILAEKRSFFISQPATINPVKLLSRNIYSFHFSRHIPSHTNTPTTGPLLKHSLEGVLNLKEL